MKKIIFIFLLFLSIGGFAQDFPTPMQPRRLVNDFTEMFSQQERDVLEQKLRAFNDTTSTQIAVVTVPSLNNYDPMDYAQQLAEKWGIGQKGKDNGILLLIKPKNRESNGQVAIAVGYGLEGVVPDAIASRIIRNELIPEFQKGNFYAGIRNATDVLMKLTAGEFTAEQYANSKKENSIWILLPFAIFILLGVFGRRNRGYTTGSRGDQAVPPIFFGGIGGRGSNFGSFSGGSGSFGGFGGGGFGGGGASGSW